MNRKQAASVHMQKFTHLGCMVTKVVIGLLWVLADNARDALRIQKDTVKRNTFSIWLHQHITGCIHAKVPKAAMPNLRVHQGTGEKEGWRWV